MAIIVFYVACGKFTPAMKRKLGDFAAVMRVVKCQHALFFHSRIPMNITSYFSTQLFKGKTVFITGGSGINLGIAKNFAAGGINGND